MIERKTPPGRKVSEEEMEVFRMISVNTCIMRDYGYPNANLTYKQAFRLFEMPFGMKVLRKISPEIERLADEAKRGNTGLEKEVDALNERLKKAVEQAKTPTIEFTPEEVEATRVENRSHLHEKESAKPESKTCEGC